MECANDADARWWRGTWIGVHEGYFVERVIGFEIRTIAVAVDNRKPPRVAHIPTQVTRGELTEVATSLQELARQVLGTCIEDVLIGFLNDLHWHTPLTGVRNGGGGRRSSAGRRGMSGK